MCLGESTTAVGGEDAYPYQLQEILNENNMGIRFSVINKGVPGAHTSAIIEQLESNLNKYKPDMVIAMMGINDMYGWDLVSYTDTPMSKKACLLNH